MDKKTTYIIVGVIFATLVAWLGWQQYSQTEAKLREATILTEKQANEAKSLEEQLNLPGER